MAVLLLVIVSTAGAASLGRLAVLSAIGGPLRVEIELSISPEELESAIPRLAPVDAYAQAGLQYNPALNGARLAIQYRHNGRRVIDLVTTRPVNEPSLALLVELEVRGGRIARAYHVLLGLQAEASAGVAPSFAAAPAEPVVTAPVVQSAPAVPAASRTPARATGVRAASANRSAVDNAAFDRELRRLESQLNASGKVLADMLDRVAVMERQVAQLQKVFAAQSAAAAAPVAKQPAAETPVPDKPAAATPPVTSPAPASAVAAVSAVAATAPRAAEPAKPEAALPPIERIEAQPRARQGSILEEAVLVLAGGLLVMLFVLAYLMWGRRRPARDAPPQQAG